jgi:hypothetical protein
MATPNPLPSTRHLLTSLISTIASSTQQQNQGEETSNPLSNTAATSQNTKSAFLTLHSLFPHDFLPALDLLDRGLVTRFILTGDSEASEQLEPDRSAGGGGDDDGYKNDNNEAHTEEHPQDEDRTEQHTQPQPKYSLKRKRKQTVVYQVRSAQRSKTSSSRSEYPTSTTTTTGASYEVRLKAWNCSCPAFAFAALPVDAAENGNSDGGIGEDEDDDDVEYGLAGNESHTTTATHNGEDETAWLGFGGLTRGKDVPVCKHLLACVAADRCQGFEQLVEEKEVGVEEIAGWAAGWGD